MKTGSGRCLTRSIFSFVSPGVVGKAKDIVGGHVVISGEFDQYLCRNIPLTQFVVAVDLLGTTQKIGYLPLL